MYISYYNTKKELQVEKVNVPYKDRKMFCYESRKNIYIASHPSHFRNLNQSISPVEIRVVKAAKNAFGRLFSGYSKNLNAYNPAAPEINNNAALFIKREDIEAKFPISEDFVDEYVESFKFKGKYEKLLNKYLNLVSEMNDLKNENEKLKLPAYKSYNDLKEEINYEISRTTMERDSLLILMELRENKKLKFIELSDKVTQSGNLFLRLSDLSKVNFVTLDEETGDFSITPKGVDFLEKRGL